MGSPNGIWTSVSGGMAQSQNIDTIANNLANAGTVGFKKDTPTFKEYLTAVEAPPSPALDIPRTAFKDSDLYHHDGKEHAKVNLNQVHTDYTQGLLKPTNAPLDFAIEGSGFFAIQGPGGIAFTRAGNFKLNGEGDLVTVDGFKVLSLEAGAGEAEETPAQGNENRTLASAAKQKKSVFVDPKTQIQKPGEEQASPLQPINLKAQAESGAEIRVSQDGVIFANQQEVGRLAIAEFSNPKALQKLTSNLYVNKDEQNFAKPSEVPGVRQGFLEQSNVNAVAELMELLKANRLFESNMKAIRTYSELSAKEANEVGKL